MRLTFVEKFLLNLAEFLTKSNSKRFSINSFEQFLFKKNKKAPLLISEGNFRQGFRYLLKIGCIKEIGKNKYLLTNKGFLKNIKARARLKKQTRKPLNKKWQMVIFDIPETKRKSRDVFRKNIKMLGFKQYQKSIWICHYDFLKELKVLIEAAEVKPYVRVCFVKEVYKPV